VRYTFAQAEAFYWTARAGGFRAAAARMNLAQPTVSLRVRELERILGGALFRRETYRPTLTPLGEAILEDVERMLSLARGIEERARGSGLRRRSIRIGAADSFATIALPRLLGELARRDPALQAEVTVDFSSRLEALLLDGKIDLAFISDPRAPNELSLTPLWDIELVWVVGAGFPFQGDRIAPEDLVDQPVFTNPAPSNLYLSIQRWFALRGLRPERLNTCGPLHILMLLAGAGTGGALLPRELATGPHGIQGLRLLRPVPDIPPHTLHAAYRSGDETPDVGLVARLAVSMVADIMKQDGA
jgi:DNA-binding transcriptional LysR family regulator